MDADPGYPEVDVSKLMMRGRGWLKLRASNRTVNKEQYEKLSSDVQVQLNSTLHETLCESIITLLKDSIENPGLTKEEI